MIKTFDEQIKDLRASREPLYTQRKQIDWQLGEINREIERLQNEKNKEYVGRCFLVDGLYVKVIGEPEQEYDHLFKTIEGTYRANVVWINKRRKKIKIDSILVRDLKNEITNEEFNAALDEIT